MNQIDRHTYETMIGEATVLSGSADSGHVWLRPDGMVVKIFRTQTRVRRLFRRPYAFRFLHSARRLQKLGIQSVQVHNIEYVKSLGFYLVTYPRLDGIPLRSLDCDESQMPEAMAGFVAFIATLHDKGVYFRAMHLGNVLWCDDKTYSLIDVTDCRFLRRSLPVNQRVRNFKPPLRYASDVNLIQAFGPARFIHSYLETAQYSGRARHRFLRGISQLHPVYHDIERRVSEVSLATA